MGDGLSVVVPRIHRMSTLSHAWQLHGSMGHVYLNIQLRMVMSQGLECWLLAFMSVCAILCICWFEVCGFFGELLDFAKSFYVGFCACGHEVWQCVNFVVWT